MTITPDQPGTNPGEEVPDDPGPGPSEVPPVTEPDVEGDPDIVAPNPLEDA
jgi:hypothetical protein